MRLHKPFALMIGLTLASALFGAEPAKKEAPPNCQVKLVKEAGASSIELDFFATGKDQCLHMAEPDVKAVFKPSTIERHKRGAGPEQ